MVLGERADFSLREGHRDSFGRIEVTLAQTLVLENPDIWMVRKKWRGGRKRFLVVRAWGCGTTLGHGTVGTGWDMDNLLGGIESLG
jgi:hypothetical protein